MDGSGTATLSLRDIISGKGGKLISNRENVKKNCKKQMLSLTSNVKKFLNLCQGTITSLGFCSPQGKDFRKCDVKCTSYGGALGGGVNSRGQPAPIWKNIGEGLIVETCVATIKIDVDSQCSLISHEIILKDLGGLAK